MLCRLKLLVTAPAAVEESLALLLQEPHPGLLELASTAYIQRLYAPFLLSGPQAAQIGGSALTWTFDPKIDSGVLRAMARFSCFVLPVATNNKKVCILQRSATVPDLIY